MTKFIEHVFIELRVFTFNATKPLYRKARRKKSNSNSTIVQWQADTLKKTIKQVSAMFLLLMRSIIKSNPRSVSVGNHVVKHC